MKKFFVSCWIIGMATASFGVVKNKERRGKKSSRPILTLIGIDAGEWKAINYLRGLGVLPTIDRMIKEGTHGKLESIHPMFTPIVWTTVATGVTPLKHGIRGFKLHNPETNNKVPVNRTMRRVNAVWNILSQKGLNSLVVSWYGTWPAERIKGTIISDYTWPLKNTSLSEHFLEEKTGIELKEQTFPRHYYHKLKRFFVDKFKENDKFRQRFNSSVAKAPYVLKHSYAKDLTYFRIYKQLRQAKHYDFTSFYIQGPDLLAHKFWREFEMYTDGRLKEGTKNYMQAQFIVRYYKFIDQILRVYDQDIRTENETLIILSDHGFKDLGKDVLTKVSDEKYAKKRYWHNKHGILIADGPSVNGGTVTKGATVFDITPTILTFFNLPYAKDMPGKPLINIIGDERSVIKKVASFEKPLAKKLEIRESNYDKSILKSLNDLGYIQ
jgi:predicted AlkP superfamily phosphohydrolase/phosphomutase